MEKKKMQLIKKIVIICLAIIILELIVMFIMRIMKERKIDRIDSLNNVIAISDGYIGVGESDFSNSDFVHSKTYWFTPLAGKKQNIIATQARIVKFDKDMQIIWENTISGDYDSNFYDVEITDDGYIAVGSYIKDYKQIEAKTRDAIVVKYDTNGKVIWTNTYSVLSDTEFFRIIKDDDNFVIIGQSIYENMEVGSHTIGGGIIVRINQDGEIIAHNNYGGNKSGIFNDIVKVKDGYIVCGRDATNYGIVVKFKKDFNRDEKDTNIISNKIAWQRTYSNTDNEGFTSMVMINDKIIVSGALNVSDEKDKDDNPIYKYQAGMVTYNTSGKYIGKNILDDTTHHRFTSSTSDGSNIYLTLLMNVDDYSDGATRNSMIYKYDLEGNVIKKVLYEDNGKNNFINKIIKIDDNYLVIGTTNDKCNLLDGCDYQPILRFYNSELERVE